MKTFIGLDYSMNSPGACVLNEDKIDIFSFYSGNVERSKYSSEKFTFRVCGNVNEKANRIKRFDELACLVISTINSNCKLVEPVVFIEGYSMGSKGQVFQIAECAMMVKYYFYKAGIETIEVAPTTVKKFATGKGNAKKEDMYDAFMKQTKVDLKGLLTPNRKLGSPVTDLIDAYYIAAFGQEQCSNEKSSKEGG